MNDEEFDEYVQRFRRLFYVPDGTRLISAMGNHDIGFHYRTHPFFVNRFNKAFNSSGVDLVSLRGNHFVIINSVAMERDGCEICERAERRLKRLACE